MDGYTHPIDVRSRAPWNEWFSIDEDIPIIFLTAKSQTQDVVEGFTIGGNDYLKKL